MKVYQIEKTTGEWEDTYHTIVGTYLSKSRAEVELERLKQKTKEEYKCMDCPYSWERSDKPLDVDCPEHKPENENEGMSDMQPDYYCENWIDSYDAPSYKLLEFDVDESEV